MMAEFALHVSRHVNKAYSAKGNRIRYVNPSHSEVTLTIDSTFLLAVTRTSSTSQPKRLSPHTVPDPETGQATETASCGSDT
jgi:hypothetical protein